MVMIREDFVVARNPDTDSSLPYLIRLPLGPDAIVLKARDTWPRTSKVYCHRAPEWPPQPEVVERVGVRSCVRRALAAGDYGVELDGTVVASVERKTLADLVASLTTGKLRYALAELAALERAAVVVEDRYSSVFRQDHVRPAVVADALAEAQVRFPTVPIIFCETRPLAEEWTYRFLGAALDELSSHSTADELAATMTPAGPLNPVEPSTASIRAWAVAAGIPVSARGRLRPEVRQAYLEVHASGGC
jgi:hypothetical protein